jgi:hypothetical protein
MTLRTVFRRLKNIYERANLLPIRSIEGCFCGAIIL